jgi:hypothetical protein
MRKFFMLFLLQGALLSVVAQDSRSKTIEQRAREFHRVIGLDDKEQWKKFITENYTKSLIEKPMKAVVKTSDQQNTEVKTSMENIEEKTAMFQRLHQDFGNSKIRSLKPNGENLEMVLEGSKGLIGTFNLAFDKKSPYLVDGIGIQVVGTNR